MVERCIYGVDLDPLAVELCRLSLWIETMDRTLPFSFLDHKVKCGNALVGAWFDTFRHYPVMAFKNREGGDKGHSNGVHFAKDARGKALKAFVKDVLTPDLRALPRRTPALRPAATCCEQAAAVHDGALATLARLHDLPVQDAAERARVYREELLGSPAVPAAQGGDGPVVRLLVLAGRRAGAGAAADDAGGAPGADPRPRRSASPPTSASSTGSSSSPTSSALTGAGFDAVLGNPPWETLQPNSKEFFSNIDPLYRTYGKQEALRCQTRVLRTTETSSTTGSTTTPSFASYSQLDESRGQPLRRSAEAEADGDRFAIARGRENEALHDRWREARAESRGYADAQHPFRHRGEGKAYTYKLFLEQAHALLRAGGRLGFIVPSGLYSDAGTGGLRELFLDHCRWEWLFGFENRDEIFDIHRSLQVQSGRHREGRPHGSHPHGLHAPRPGGLGARRGARRALHARAGRALQPALAARSSRSSRRATSRSSRRSTPTRCCSATTARTAGA